MRQCLRPDFLEIHNNNNNNTFAIVQSTVSDLLEDSIPNGCFDGYEVKVNKDIFQYQEKVKLISLFQRSFEFSNGLLQFASLP